VPRAASNSFRETFVPLALLAGDTLVTFTGLSLGYALRYASPLGRLGLNVPDATFSRYLPLLLLGVTLLIGAFAQLGLYDSRLLLRRYQNLGAILKGTAFWLAAYLGVSLVLKFNPPISRLFAVLAFVCVLILLTLWRALVHFILTRPVFRGRLQRRTALLGWNEGARELAAEILDHPAHPLAFAGIVTLPGDLPPRPGSDTATVCHLIDDQQSPAVRHLGQVAELDGILVREGVDLLIATRLDLPRDDMQRIVESCERAYVEWKIIPTAFPIFLSGLRLQTIGRLPVLGVDELPITKLFNRALKRLADIAGSFLGLVIFALPMLVLAVRIKRESPGGPVLFGQTRVGDGHRPFTLYKLRSMAPDAAATDAAQQSTAGDDPRLLRLGAWMRRWNLDELPQFWNVLRGDMSLVGPRPERPYHVEQLSHAIAHYLPRHLVKPGMTGWAQVHGLRGDSDLAARIQHDIYYIENWSPWLDVQILALTFVRWKNNA
jgi:exopolysaccharide biosynthesis polyprenyl glycosylphosphotransferase